MVLIYFINFQQILLDFKYNFPNKYPLLPTKRDIFEVMGIWVPKECLIWTFVLFRYWLTSIKKYKRLYVK